MDNEAAACAASGALRAAVGPRHRVLAARREAGVVSGKLEALRP